MPLNFHANHVDALNQVIKFFANMAGKVLHFFHELSQMVQGVAQKNGKPQGAKRQYQVEHIFIFQHILKV